MLAILKIPNFSNYEIYPKEGKIWSIQRNKYIGSHKNNGYWDCTLYSDNGVKWNSGIHRIIYTACYGEIPEGMEVNHIDENANNNSIFNLNLLNRKDNCNWGTRNERSAKSKSKPVGAFINGLLLLKFQSVREAGRNGFSQGNVCACCNNNYKRKGNNIYKGYEWRYIDEKVS